MTTKADFNAEEWAQVQQAPAIAGLLVIAADRGGTIRESVSMGRAYSEARREHGRGDLLGELVSAAPQLDAKQFSSADDLSTRAPQLLSEAVATVEGKGASAAEVEDFKRFCLSVAEHAATATKSGGVLGIGGKRISEAESAALDRIASTLAIERTTTGPAPAEGG